MENKRAVVTNEIVELEEMSNERTVRVGSVQCSSVLADTPKNIRKLTSLIRRAAAGGAKIVVTPECCVTGYVSQDFETNYRLPERPMARSFKKSIDPTEHSMTIDGPEVKHFLELANELNIYLTIPFIERETEKEMKERIEKEKKEEEENPGRKVTKHFENKKYRFFNTIALASPSGDLVGHYRKIFPWMYPEKSWVTAGTKIATHESEYGKIGLAVCFDIHEIPKKYEGENLWALLYVVAWVDDTPKYWFKDQLPEHLKKSNVDYHILMANWSVDEEQDGYEGYGHTTVYDKNQKIIGQAKTNIGTEIIYTEVPF